jgi:hypothetical protein
MVFVSFDAVSASDQWEEKPARVKQIRMNATVAYNVHWRGSVRNPKNTWIDSKNIQLLLRKPGNLFYTIIAYGTLAYAKYKCPIEITSTRDWIIRLMNYLLNHSRQMIVNQVSWHRRLRERRNSTSLLNGLTYATMATENKAISYGSRNKTDVILSADVVFSVPMFVYFISRCIAGQV